MALPSAIVDKLAKVCGLLGSDKAGEVAAAAHKATEILRAANLTWRQLVEAAGNAPITYEASTRLPSWRTQVETCLAEQWRLTDWEQDFVRSLARYHRRPSHKQLQLLAAMHEKVTAP